MKIIIMLLLLTSCASNRGTKADGCKLMLTHAHNLHLTEYEYQNLIIEYSKCIK